METRGSRTGGRPLTLNDRSRRTTIPQIMARFLNVMHSVRPMTWPSSGN